MAFLEGGEFCFVGKNGPDQGFLQEPAAAFHAGLGQGQVPISTAVTALASLPCTGLILAVVMAW